MAPDNIEELYSQLEPLGFLDHLDAEARAWLNDVARKDGIWRMRPPGDPLRATASDWPKVGCATSSAKWSHTCERRERPPLNARRSLMSKATSISLPSMAAPIIGGRRDLERNPVWVAASVRAFKIIEQLLGETGSVERVYALKGDLALSSTCIFLTPEMAEEVNSSPRVPDDQKLMTVDEVGAWTVGYENQDSDEE